MTSLEYWCFACLAFTFGSLVSYVIILIMLELSSIKAKVKFIWSRYLCQLCNKRCQMTTRRLTKCMLQWRSINSFSKAKTMMKGTFSWKQFSLHWWQGPLQPSVWHTGQDGMETFNPTFHGFEKVNKSGPSLVRFGPDSQIWPRILKFGPDSQIWTILAQA